MTRTIFAAAIMLATVVAADAQGRHRGYYGHYRGGGDAFVGGIVGGVIGGVIGGAINRPQYYQPAPVYDPVADCMRRFRSYNPETGVYFGYDGMARRCP